MNISSPVKVSGAALRVCEQPGPRTADERQAAKHPAQNPSAADPSSVPADIRAAFVRAHTAIAEVPHCRGLRLHTALSFTATWEAAEAAGLGTTAPYWAVPWVGGQALARHLLAHPELVARRRILELGAGGGLCAIAAALAGAARVQTFDVDPVARTALAVNASLNGVSVESILQDPIETDVGDWEVILAADLWYERFLAQRVTPWLRAQARAGLPVLLGDRGRAYFPRRGVKLLSRYDAVDVADTESDALVASAVWKLRADARG